VIPGRAVSGRCNHAKSRDVALGIWDNIHWTLDSGLLYIIEQYNQSERDGLSRSERDRLSLPTNYVKNTTEEMLQLGLDVQPCEGRLRST
jgi:hypothetical protein